MAEQVSRTELRASSTGGANMLEGRYYLMEQESDCLQSVFCCFCEASNEFSIAEADPNFNVSSKKGYIKESSDCTGRCLCVCNRPFEAKMRLFNQEIAVAQRECRCCLEYMPCLENEVTVTNAGGRVLGILRVDCWCLSGSFYSCADTMIKVLDEKEELLYTVEGRQCQRGLICPWMRSCYCPIVEYDILDNINLKVGKISNIYNGCLTECFSRTDKFGVEFPSKIDQDSKILLTFAVMYLDYLRYETPVVCAGFR